jgi:hypothetical protein
VSFATLIIVELFWGHTRISWFEWEAVQRPRLPLALVQPGSRNNLLPTLRQLSRLVAVGPILILNLPVERDVVARLTGDGGEPSTPRGVCKPTGAACEDVRARLTK